MNSLKPKKRSKLRIFFGKKVYRLKRYSEWYMDGKKYATKRSVEKLNHVVFQTSNAFASQIERCRDGITNQ